MHADKGAHQALCFFPQGHSLRSLFFGAPLHTSHRVVVVPPSAPRKTPWGCQAATRHPRARWLFHRPRRTLAWTGALAYRSMERNIQEFKGAQNPIQALRCQQNQLVAVLSCCWASASHVRPAIKALRARRLLLVHCATKLIIAAALNTVIKGSFEALRVIRRPDLLTLCLTGL